MIRTSAYPGVEKLIQRPEASPYYTEEDHLFVQQMLGLEESYCDLNADTYDERQIISQSILEERERRRQQLITLAQERLGYTPEQANTEGKEWAPSVQDLDSLFTSPTIRKERKRATMLDGITAFVEDYEAVAKSMGASLRKHQIPAIHAFHNFMLDTERSDGGGKRGIFEMATGLGKTAILSKITAALKHNEHPDEPVRVLILTPTNTILDQTVGNDGKRGFGKFAPHLKVGVQNQFEKYNNEEVAVMTVASFDRLISQGRMPHFDAVIVDEVHTVMGEKTYPRLTEYCKDKLAIGLSATPAYDEKRNAYNFFEHQIYREPLKEAIQDGHLAPLLAKDLVATPVAIAQRPPADPDKLRAYLHRVELESRVAASIPLIKQAIENGKGVIIKCPAGEDIKFARDLAKDISREYVYTKGESLLSRRRISAHFVGGSTKQQKPEERRLTLKMFDTGQIDVLTYVQAIGMGWDGDAKVLIDLTDGDSELDSWQTLGRILRLTWDDKGNPVVAEAYSFKDPRHPKRRTFCGLLGVESGTIIKHGKRAQIEVPLPTRRKRMRVRSPEVIAARLSVVAQVAIENTKAPEPPTAAEIRQGLETIRGKQHIDFQEAQRILGIQGPTLRGILGKFGIQNVGELRLSLDDIGAILEMEEFERLRVRTLPEDGGYTPAQDFARELGVRVATLNQYGWASKLPPERLRNPTTGDIGFYYSEKTKQDLLARIQESGLLSHKLH